MGIHVFPILNLLPTPSPSHPSGSSQCTSPEHLVSCIEPGLAIYFIYDNIHISMLFSQIIPLLPSPTESKSPSPWRTSPQRPLGGAPGLCRGCSSQKERFMNKAVPKVGGSCLHLCLLCCPTCGIVITVFLNSIYMC